MMAFLATVLSVTVIQMSATLPEYPMLYRFMFSSLLGIPLFISLQLVSERLEVGRRWHYLMMAGGMILLALYFMSIPSADYPKIYTRFAVYMIMLILCVSSAPFIGIRQNLSFWQFNSIIIFRFLRTLLYGIILYVSVSLAFVALEQLFNISLGEKLYFQLWVTVAVFFGTWFFLSAIPPHFHKLNQHDDYSSALKIFVQFILIPIVILYSLILYAYFVKIIAMWEWPHGWVASLILGYSVLSIFTFLVVYPIRTAPNNTYVRFFSSFFPYLLWPLILILFIAIIKRVSDYGLTENRYFVIILGIWLLFIMSHLLMTRFRNIKMIPVSLAVIMFLSVTGPWSAFMMSRASQLNRFEKLLDQYHKTEEGKYKANEEVMTYEDYQQLLSHTNYIIQNYGHQSFLPYFSGELDSVKWDSVFVWEYSPSNPVTDLMAIEFVEDTSAAYQSIYIRTSNMETPLIYDISEYDYYCPFDIVTYHYMNQLAVKQFDYHAGALKVSVRTDSACIEVFRGDSLIDRLDISALVASIPGQVSKDSLHILNPRYLQKITQPGAGTKIMYSINLLTADSDRTLKGEINEMKGFVLVRLK
jgi:hypothetical protein